MKVTISAFKARLLHRGILFLLCATFVNVSASDFRAPSLLERGPLRVLFGEDDGEPGLTTWAVAFNRTAKDAYTENHGTETEPISAMWFNKADFRMTEIFPESLVPVNSEFMNPLLRTAKLHLRANYIENGVSFGLRWDHPFYHEKGRIGIRAHCPIKRIKVEKIDTEGVRSGAELQDVLSIKPVTNTVQGGSLQDQDSLNQVAAIRLDFAEALTQASDKASAVRYNVDSRMLIAANAVDNVEWDGDANDENNIAWIVESGASDAARKVPVLAVYSPEGQIPRNPNAEIVLRTDAGTTAAKSFPENGSISAGNVYFFDKDIDYQLLADDDSQVDLERRLTNQDVKANVWLIPIQRTTNDVPAMLKGGTMYVLQNLAKQATGNVYEWLYDRGMVFESFTSEGVGDVDVEGFYEHTFSEELIAEFSIGVRVPTAKKSKYITSTIIEEDGALKEIANPYRIPLGNNGHWEVKGGGVVSWQPSKHFGVKGSAYYSMVLAEEEERAACFNNAFVKNIGPKADAEVDWGYFVARVDLNLTHPKTTDINAVIGYEFMYKREEDVRFTSTKMAAWYGTLYNSTTGAYDETTYTLDNDLSSQHTNSIAHRLRLEVAWILSDYLECFWGGAWTAAGKNMPRELDIHAGFHVAF